MAEQVPEAPVARVVYGLYDATGREIGEDITEIAPGTYTMKGSTEILREDIRPGAYVHLLFFWQLLDQSNHTIEGSRQSAANGSLIGSGSEFTVGEVTIPDQEGSFVYKTYMFVGTQEDHNHLTRIYDAPVLRIKRS